MSLLLFLRVKFCILFVLVRRCGAQNTDGKSGFLFLANAIILFDKLSEEA